MTKKIRTKKWLSALFAIPVIGIFPLTSCGLNEPWSFDVSTNHATQINYCLLIGQNDHADSIERTRYTRKALNTLDESEETKTRTKDNPNIAAPVQGYIDVTPPNSNDTVTIPVTEIEQMEQKSFAGATWDAITANDTAGTWIAKHGHNITFFVSNNDSMAEGAMWASNWIKGMPIFGYDANATTIQRINSGSITGTVDQNASTQCGSVMMLTRNMLEDRDVYWANGCVSDKRCNYFGSESYDPMHTGFANGSTEGEKMKYGWVDSTYISKSKLLPDTNRELLSRSTAIAHLEGDPELDNVSDYINQETGEALQPVDLVDHIVHVKKDAKPETSYSVCHAYCNRAETYLVATLRPYFNEYANRLNLNLDIVEGDGTDEAIVINQIDARPTGANDFDAYLINMAKTTSTHSYIAALAKRAYEKEKKWVPNRPAISSGWEWKDRLDTPLIFWNRQPHAEDGTIDKEIMNNKYFKYTYFVGVDAAAGGEEQGKMIAKHIQRWYEKWYQEQHQ